MRTTVSALVLVLIGLSSLWLWNESTESADDAMAGVVLTDEPAQGAEDTKNSSGAADPYAEAASPEQAAAERAAQDALSSLSAKLGGVYAGMNQAAAARAEEAAAAEAEREAESEASAEAQAETEREAEAQAEREAGAEPRSSTAGSGGSSSGSDDSSPQPVSPPPVQLDDDDDDDSHDDDGDDDDDDGDDDDD